jgi:cell shape-determining protein MreD
MSTNKTYNNFMELERKKYWLLLFGLIIGVTFDILFYNKTLGISYLIFVVLILLILLLSFWDSLKKLRNLAWIFAAPALLLHQLSSFTLTRFSKF